MNEIEIGNASHLNWLWLAMFVAALSVFSLLWNRHALLKFATPNLIRSIFVSRRWQWVSSTLLALATILLLVVCLIDIRWGQVQREVPQKGIEVIFVLDVSRSMLAEDVAPNRLERAKQMIKDTIEEMAGDRIGLTIFAGDVRRKIPMTSHYDDFKQNLDEVSPSDISRGGSKLGDAITIGAEGFLTKTNDHKAMVLLTDGEDQESKPIEAARQVKADLGVRIFTIGLGDLDEGARIPIESTGGFLQHQGEQVWSRLNGEVLTQVATETGGAYIPAGTKQVNMAEIYHGFIANVEEKEFQTAKINQFEARFQWFLAPALLLLVLQILVGSQGRRSIETP